MDINTVVFDLDGTLINSKKDIVVAVNNTLIELKLPTLSEKVIAGFLGYGVETLIRCCIGEESIHKMDNALEIYREYYSDNCTVYTTLYPGVKETLEFLIKRGISVALATNKMISISRKILRYFGIEEYFSYLLGSESVRNKKPDPEIINILLEITKHRPENMLFVGDSEIDILCGKNAKTHTCAVTYGIGTTKSIIKANPDFLITDLRKLILLIS